MKVILDKSKPTKILVAGISSDISIEITDDHVIVFSDPIKNKGGLGKGVTLYPRGFSLKVDPMDISYPTGKFQFEGKSYDMTSVAIKIENTIEIIRLFKIDAGPLEAESHIKYDEFASPLRVWREFVEDFKKALKDQGFGYIKISEITAYKTYPPESIDEELERLGLS